MCAEMECEKGDKMKKVSIVVPVYNAQDFLGRCLNSILTQQYRNFEVIIINDGSTDGSLAICKNYAKLDKRFKVISIENGGVSNARNIGVKHATGSYLTFIDSDDIVDGEYLSKMVTAAEKYKTSLVISDLVMVDFNNPKRKVILTGRSYSSKKPLVISKSVFMEKMMTLIIKTSLLESGCGKLMDLRKWKNNNIELDRSLSLGEDFLANLRYYECSDGVVFLNEGLYYYNNVDDSESLSHKHREDLFKIKMYLAKRLKEFLIKNSSLSRREQVYYFNYVAAYGMGAIEEVLTSDRYISHKDKLELIKEILSDSDFVEAVEKADYLKFPKWRNMIINKKVRELANLKLKKKSDEMSRSLKNRIVRKAVRLYYGEFRRNTEKARQIDAELASIGVKNTLRARLFLRK